MRESSARSSPADQACSRRVMSFAGSSATLLSYINSPSFFLFSPKAHGGGVILSGARVSARSEGPAFGEKQVLRPLRGLRMTSARVFVQRRKKREEREPAPPRGFAPSPRQNDESSPAGTPILMDDPCLLGVH